MEQTYMRLRDISLYLFILFLLISVFIWFKFNILETWKDLSGANSNRYLRELRKQNELNKPKSLHNPVDLNISNSKTSPILLQTGQMEESYNKKLDEMKLDKHTNPFENNKEINVASDSFNTDVLIENNNKYNYSTEVLSDNNKYSYNTEVLDENNDTNSAIFGTAMLNEINETKSNEIEVYILEEKEFVGSNKTV